MPYCDFRYFSDALQKQTSAIVLLPDPATPKPWSTLYLLHGLSDDHTMWTRRSNIERYVDGLPLVVVMPDGGRGFYCDGPGGPLYGTAIGKELPEVVESIFPVRRERTGRSIAGLSMGGYGAFKLAFTHPDTFCAAASHSGALRFGHGTSRDDAFAREFARVLGANPLGGQHDLYAIAERLDRTKLPGLRFDCGDDDYLLSANLAFREHLQKLGIPHVYEQHPGAHTWDYWDAHVRESLRFVCTAMGVGGEGIGG